MLSPHFICAGVHRQDYIITTAYQSVCFPKKKFGVYAHRVKNRKIPLVRGFDDVFYAPHSRHTEVLKEDILKHPELTILAESDDAGVFLLMDQDGKRFL